MSAAITVEIESDLFWPPLPDTGETTCAHYKGFIVGQNEYRSQDSEIDLRVLVPAYGCLKCDYRLQPRWENRVIRKILDRKLKLPFQLGLFAQFVRLSVKAVDVEFVL